MSDHVADVMSEEQVRESLRWCNLALCGPWTVTPLDDGTYIVAGPSGVELAVAKFRREAEFMAASRGLLPRALRDLRDLRAANERLFREVARLNRILNELQKPNRSE